VSKFSILIFIGIVLGIDVGEGRKFEGEVVAVVGEVEFVEPVDGARQDDASANGISGRDGLIPNLKPGDGRARADVVVGDAVRMENVEPLYASENHLAVAESVRCPDFEGVALQLVLYRKMPDRVIPGIEAGDSVAADPEGSVVVLLQALQFVIEEPGVGCVETAETGRFPAATTFGHKEETFADRCDPKTPPLFPVSVNSRDEGIGTTHLPFTGVRSGEFDSLAVRLAVGIEYDSVQPRAGSDPDGLIVGDGIGVDVRREIGA